CNNTASCNIEHLSSRTYHDATTNISPSREYLFALFNGHLMGKKSTDEQVRPEESEGDDKTLMTTPDQDLLLERFNKHLPPLLYALMRGRTGAESTQDGTEEVDAPKLLERMLTRRRQWEEDHERDRQVKLIEDFLLKALRMQDDNQS
ncbi:hypothetical protein PO909_007808, partial [Leuciscus waleckii]